MNRLTKAAAAAPAMSLIALMTLAGPASAADGSTQAQLQALNESGASGSAMVTVSGNMLTVKLASQGLLADQPHAAHIHFTAEARHECPIAKDDANGDGNINTTEGDPAYGEVVVSLTKTGDTSADSVLAINRFDTAPGGTINYERGSIQVNDDVAQAVVDGEAVVVVHGVDYNDSGKYDGKTKSDLDPKLPTEATDPALCGTLNISQMGSTPTGGAETGSGSTTGVENEGIIALGGVTLLGGLALAMRRRFVSSNIS
ncbi:MAG: CHRD domain-containing protein [Actinomycetia bacterium]|nr:CHRD domain-containing protein [Actinomycetes bacterium]